MSKNRDLREAVKAFMANNQGEEMYSILCIVNAVDEAALTCDVSPIYEGADILDCKLMPLSIDGEVQKGFVQIPTVDSVVIVTMLNTDEGYIAMASSLDFLRLNGNEYGGLVIIGKLVERMNRIEKAYNDLKTKFNAHTHTVSVVTTCGAGAGSGTGSAVATSTPEPTTLIETQVSDLENKTVTHGKGNTL